tara:strand:- start:1038 stop:1460 length:423 start_codon:yes stop_codon:yes gene_type:complete
VTELFVNATIFLFGANDIPRTKGAQGARSGCDWRAGAIGARVRSARGCDRRAAASSARLRPARGGRAMAERWTRDHERKMVSQMIQYGAVDGEASCPLKEEEVRKPRVARQRQRRDDHAPKARKATKAAPVIWLIMFSPA